jgi:hypothetical protein
MAEGEGGVGLFPKEARDLDVPLELIPIRGLEVGVELP